MAAKKNSVGEELMSQTLKVFSEVKPFYSSGLDLQATCGKPH